MSTSRKDACRRYKETIQPMGVYHILNSSTGAVFIGSSVNIPAILNRERFSLEFGNHRNDPLQEDWNKFGADTFKFGVIEYLEPVENQSREDRLRDLAELEKMVRERIMSEGGIIY
jgi:hypothetical protein